MSAEVPPTVTHRVVFSGRVQGVGFRYTACGIARKHPVTGFVRNQPDGTVELVAQGSTTAINDFLTDLVRQFQDNIWHVDRQDHATSDRYSAFDLRR